MDRFRFRDIEHYGLAIYKLNKHYRWYLAKEEDDAIAIAALAAWEAQGMASGDAGRAILRVIHREIFNAGYLRFDRSSGRPDLFYEVQFEGDHLVIEDYGETFGEMLARAWNARYVRQQAERANNPEYVKVPCGCCGTRLLRLRYNLKKHPVSYCDLACRNRAQKPWVKRWGNMTLER